MENIGLRYDELDDIIDTKVLSSYRKEAVWIADTFPNIGTEIETVIVNVKLIVEKQPDRIGAVSIDITDGRDNCPVNVVVTPRGRERQNHGIRTQAGELFPERLEVIPNEMAEEDTTGDLADRCEVVTKTTAMKATTKDDVIIRPAPRLVRVEVLEETRTNENTVEECTYGIVDQTERVQGIGGFVSEIDHRRIFRVGRGGQDSWRETDSVCLYE